MLHLLTQAELQKESKMGRGGGGDSYDLYCRKTGQMGELIQPEMQEKVWLGDSLIQSELQKTARWGTHSIRTAERQGDLENLCTNDNIKSNPYMPKL